MYSGTMYAYRQKENSAKARTMFTGNNLAFAAIFAIAIFAGVLVQMRAIIIIMHV